MKMKMKMKMRTGRFSSRREMDDYRPNMNCYNQLTNNFIAQTSQDNQEQLMNIGPIEH